VATAATVAAMAAMRLEREMLLERRLAATLAA
jgi:hypothetical protein